MDSNTKKAIQLEIMARRNNNRKHMTERSLFWQHHFGVPTLDFILTYKQFIEEQINKNIEYNQIDNLDSKEFTLDKVNNILIDSKIFNNIPIPESLEEPGKFIKTYNLSGGFATAPIDFCSQAFITQGLTMKQGNFFEIGAGFGEAGIKLLTSNNQVFFNDICPENLAVIKKRTLGLMNAIFIPGECPKELYGLPTNFFDGILISRVMHFFSGELIIESLKLFHKLLKSKGKLYIICETPFLKNWSKFILEYNRRVEANIKWPGEITTPQVYESSGRSTNLPKFVHWLTKEVLHEALLDTHYQIENISYIDRYGSFPEDLILDGRESIGVIAVKS